MRCPKCKKDEELRLIQQNLRELSLLGSTSIASYHIDHTLIVNIDRRGIRSLTTCDPSSSLVYSVNTQVGEFVIMRSPTLDLNPGIILVDLREKLVDARLLANNLYAISFVRFLQKNASSMASRGIIRAYGIKYLVKSNEDILVAIPIGDAGANNAEDVAEKVTSSIQDFPPDICMILRMMKEL